MPSSTPVPFPGRAKLVDSEDPPLRLLLGSLVYDLAFDISRQRTATWEATSRAAEEAVEAPEGYGS
jgi:hypothetical protein